MSQFYWRAIYKDGTVLNELSTLPPCQQWPHVGQHHGFACIDKAAVAALEWRWMSNAKQRLRVEIPPGAQPILFRRHIIKDVLNRPERFVIHVIGWQASTPDGHSTKKLVAVMPDDSILETGDDAAIDWQPEKAVV